MKCIFCAAKASRGGEHIWPDRLAPEIRQYLPLETDTARSYASFESSKSDRVVKQRNGNTYKTKVPCVCDNCNNRWMNNLDQAVYEDVLALLHGRSANLNQTALRRFASWVAMKTMVGEQRNPQTAAFTQEHHVNLYLTGQPPVGFHVHLGICGAAVWANAWHRQPQRFSVNGKDGQYWRAITVWGIGQLIIFTEFCQLNQIYSPPPPILTVPAFPRSNDLQWPPPVRLPIEVVSKIATRYHPDYKSAAEDELTWGERPRGDQRKPPGL